MATLLQTNGLDLIPSSLVADGDVEYGAGRDGLGRRLIVSAPAGAAWLDAFEGVRSPTAGNRTLFLGPASPRNARALRQRLPWLKTRLCGLHTSAGFGDRLGLATPGHIHALRAVGGGVAAVFAQQSIREMTRTGRSPQDVMDDAMWSVFAEGWRDGFGSDADHLKSTVDIDNCLAAGFTGFTVDPGDHVDGSADEASEADLMAALDRLPWDVLEDSDASLFARYGEREIAVEEHSLVFDKVTVARAAAKYGKAVAHVVQMYRHLLAVAGRGNFELEVSVDETETPTAHEEHYYVASELKRLGVEWVALAPRYVGRFEKGVDYIGNLDVLERHLSGHAAVARAFGPYKLSLHSGSDKFSVYPIAAKHGRGYVHLKTAGTSYLEALRTIANVDPSLFVELYNFARSRYEVDRASYHVSASLNRAPKADTLTPREYPKLLDQFDAREILHVTFGSVLTDTAEDGERRYYGRFVCSLQSHPTVYAEYLESHFVRHLSPFLPGRI